jgi:glycosyltransferase involved in cell wall biosynthesis
MTNARPRSTPNHRIAYISGVLPSRSETFVYREILALRERGLYVTPVSVHRPQRDLGSRAVDRLADEVDVVYSDPVAVVRDAVREILGRPVRSLSLFARALRDAVREPDVSLVGRPKILVQAFAALALARRLRARRITHVHAHMANVPTTIAMYAARHLAVPFSFTGHAADIFRDRVMLEAKLRRAAFVACISEWHRRFYRRIVPVEKAKLPVVRCGVDVTIFLPSGIGSNGLQILAVGRLVAKKGFDVLLEAVSRLVRKGLPVVCDLVGEGPDRARLERIRQDLSLGDRVRFHGALANERIRTMMQQAGIFVLPCRVARDGDRDGIPVVLMEAMACGLCVIAGDLPTIRELVIDGETGIMVKPGSADALAAALERALEDPEALSGLREAARRHVKEEFDLEVNVTRLEAAFTGEPEKPRIPEAPVVASV